MRHDPVGRVNGIPRLALPFAASPVEEMTRLASALGTRQRLLVKRDDAITFGFGGNKVRKLEYVLARALADGADTLVTMGGVQSNHARATAAAAAKLGLDCVLIANGEAPAMPTGNALLAALLGAEVVYVPTRADRQDALEDAVARLRAAGRSPYAIPLGASTAVGALGFVRAIGELVEQRVEPDVIVHASSSGGTQAGLLAGCALYGLRTQVLGISADDPASDIAAGVRAILEGIGVQLGQDGAAFADACSIDVDDGFVGDGYGIPTAASREAQVLAARTEALFVDHTYSAKGLAGLIGAVRAHRFADDATVMFWHTGGQVGLFA